MQRSGLVESEGLDVTSTLHQRPYSLIVASFAGDVERGVAWEGGGEWGRGRGVRVAGGEEEEREGGGDEGGERERRGGGLRGG